jgi:chromate transporter
MTPPKPTLSELFFAFATISLSGFGGVLAWARRMMVEQRGWMTAEEFNETYSLCTFLPGANILNLSVVFGARVHGALGSAAAAAGLLSPATALIIVVSALYTRFGGLPAVQHALTAMAAAAAGLIIATVVKMAAPLFSRGDVFGPLIAFAACGGVGIMQWPLPAVVGVIVPISVAIAWLRRSYTLPPTVQR